MLFTDLMLGWNKILIPLGKNSVMLPYKWSMIQIPHLKPHTYAQLLREKGTRLWERDEFCENLNCLASLKPGFRNYYTILST